jgi:hypothetical protein
MSDYHYQQFEQALQTAKQHYSSKQLGQQMLDLLLQKNPEAEVFFEGIIIEDFSSRKFNLIAEHIYDSIMTPEHAQYSMVSEIYRHRYNKLFDIEYYYQLIGYFCQIIRDYSNDKQALNEIEQAAKRTIQLASEELARL